MVCRLVALRDEAQAAGFELLTFLIDVALVEAERIAEHRSEAARMDRHVLGRTAAEDGAPER